MRDVKITTCLTAYTDRYGRTWILVFNEVIWFGMRMYHSLINPNQIQMIGISVSDELFDENRKLGISYKKFFIPFQNYGTTVYFYLRAPTQHKTMEWNHIITTVETEWDPQLVQQELV